MWEELKLIKFPNLIFLMFSHSAKNLLFYVKYQYSMFRNLRRMNLGFSFFDKFEKIVSFTAFFFFFFLLKLRKSPCLMLLSRFIGFSSFTAIFPSENRSFIPMSSFPEKETRNVGVVFNWRGALLSPPLPFLFYSNEHRCGVLKPSFYRHLSLLFLPASE